MHPKAGITSHGGEPVCGFDDLPHWRGAICFPNDQCQSLPRGATFEAIPGEGRRILVPPDSQVWRRWQLPNKARPRLLPHARAVCSAAACFRAALRCLCTMMMRGCSGTAQRDA